MGMLKVCRKCGADSVKVRLHSTKLVRSRKVCFNRTLSNARNLFWRLLFVVNTNAIFHF